MRKVRGERTQEAYAASLGVSYRTLQTMEKRGATALERLAIIGAAWEEGGKAAALRAREVLGYWHQRGLFE